MFKFSEISKEEKKDYIAVAIIFPLSIIIGIIIGSNREWFQPAFFSAGYMAGSIIACLTLFTLYNIGSTLMSFRNKNKEKA